MEHISMLKIICRQKIWYFNRRVPVRFKEYDSRKNIRISLKTRCKEEAIRLAALEETNLRAYWNSLLETGQKHELEAYTQAVKRSGILGFSYIDKLQLAVGELSELIKRLRFVSDNKINEKQAEAVMGMVAQPELLLSELLPRFLELKKEIKLDKSPRQYKKWETPRQLAMRDFVNVVENKPVQTLNQKDMLVYKDWWIDRISAESVTKGTANKNMVHVKSIITSVCKSAKIKLDKEELFDDYFFQGKHYKPRLPYTTEFIRNELLNENRLKGLSDHYKKMIWIFAETGIHIDEQLAIHPENIILDNDIPYVVVTSHAKDKLKNSHRERVIPLVGYALDAFKAYPRGFTHLAENPDSVSSAIGKYLRENNLKPSDRHSLYSLRHSFQDRLTNEGCLDRVQTDLMGHAFAGRTKYGLGAHLKTTQMWLKKIQLKSED